jgi:hypothetical protein
MADTEIPRMVVCAANRYGNEVVGYFMFIGVRHFCPVMRKNMEGRDVHWMRVQFGEEQGFIDQQGVFMDRQEAWKVAEAAGQIRRRVGGDDRNGGTLYSENIY